MSGHPASGSERPVLQSSDRTPLPLHGKLELKVGALGAVAGALAGVLSLTCFLLIFDRAEMEFLPVGGTFAGLLGAVLGVWLLPLAGFTVLRRVPLWRILVVTMAGTALGGVIGVQYFTSTWIVWPVVGFAGAVVLLWLQARSRSAEP